MDVAIHLVRRGMDVAADDAFAVAGVREALQLLFVFADKADRTFHLGFDPFGKGERLKTAPLAVVVVKAVQPQQRVVSNGAKIGHPLVIGSYVVEAIAVNDEVASVR